MKETELKENTEKQNISEELLQTIKRWEKLEKDTELQELIRSIQPTPEEIKKRKQLVKKK